MFRTRLVLETMRVLGVAPEPKGISDSRPSFALLGWGILCSIANDTVRSQRGQAACLLYGPALLVGHWHARLGNTLSRSHGS